MARSLPNAPVVARSWRAVIASLTLASLLATAFAPAASAATTTNAWLAKVGTSGANGTATVKAYTTGTGSLILKLKKLQTSRTLAVALLKTSCKGATLLTLASIKTGSTGTAARTSSLTASQVTAIKKATTGTGKFAIRIGTGTTARCGVFVVQVVPAYVVAKITVGSSPSGVAIDATGVWVTNWWDNTLSRISPATNTVLSVVPLTLTGTEGPEAIASGAGSLWITTTEFADDDSSLPGSIVRIDPTTGGMLATINSGRGAYDIVYGLGAVWVTNFDDGNVLRIDPTTNMVVATIPLPSAFGVTVDATAVWVVDGTGKVSRIDPATNLVVATIPTQATGAYIAAGNGSIWVSHPGTEGLGNGSVSRINPATNAVIANIPVGERPFELAAAGGSIWVGLAGAPTVVRINAATNAVLNQLTVQYRVYALEATTGAVYAVHNLPVPEGGLEPPAGLVTRIGY
jgi:YVTN family beta-propeller protein